MLTWTYINVLDIFQEKTISNMLLYSILILIIEKPTNKGANLNFQKWLIVFLFIYCILYISLFLAVMMGISSHKLVFRILLKENTVPTGFALFIYQMFQ